MDKLKFKKINTRSGIEQFIIKVEDYSGVRLPYNYASNSEIVGAFLHGKVVGGYMLVTKPEFRSLMFIPDEIKSSNPFFKKDSFEMMEVNGLWLGSSIKTPKLQFAFWIHLLKDIFFCRKNYLLMMSNTKHKAIERIHNLTNPERLYEGVPALSGAERTHDSVRVTYTTRWNMVLNLPKYYLEMKRREGRLSETFKNRIYAQT
jgi:hypothetical protein